MKKAILILIPSNKYPAQVLQRTFIVSLFLVGVTSEFFISTDP